MFFLPASEARRNIAFCCFCCVILGVKKKILQKNKHKEIFVLVQLKVYFTSHVAAVIGGRCWGVFRPLRLCIITIKKSNILDKHVINVMWSFFHPHVHRQTDDSGPSVTTDLNLFSDLTHWTWEDVQQSRNSLLSIRCLFWQKDFAASHVSEQSAQLWVCPVGGLI